MKKYILIIIYTLFLTGCTKKISEIKKPNNLLVLVNKYNKLTNDFIPSNLIKLDINYSHNNKYLKKEAALSFYQLSKEAKKLGYNITIVSGYRSYEYQDKLFSDYVINKGLDYALMCSAKPGHSEHQTGLAIDVEGSNKDYNSFENSKEFNWMKTNAHKYGFILRYPKGKEQITGFKYEPWHYRYVGKKVANFIYTNNLTLEEYLDNI